MIQVQDMTREEKIEMYMKCTRRELAEMLVVANNHLDKQMNVVNIKARDGRPIAIYTTRQP